MWLRGGRDDYVASLNFSQDGQHIAVGTNSAVVRTHIQNNTIQFTGETCSQQFQPSRNPSTNGTAGAAPPRPASWNLADEWY